MYNLTNLTSNYGLWNTIVVVNEKAGGMFAFMILISVFLILFVGTKNFEAKRSFAVACFVTWILGILFAAGGLIAVYVPIIIGIMTGGAAIMLIAENG